MFWILIVAAGLFFSYLITLKECIFFCQITVFPVDRTTLLKWSISMKSCIFKVLNQRRKSRVHLNALFKIKVLFLVFMVQWKNVTAMEPFNCTESYF